MARIDEIIKSTIDSYLLREMVVDTFTPWDEEGKMDRMQPGNAARSQGTAPTRDFGVVRGYKDWSDNFKASGMDYPSYCKRFGLRR